jgi:hypothetical protein
MLLDEASCRTTSTPRSSFGPVIDSLKASNTHAERMYIYYIVHVACCERIRMKGT